MNDYLELTLTENFEFRTNFKADIYGIHSESLFYPSIRQSGIKIDTGAHGLLIPLRTLGWTNTQINDLVDEAVSGYRESLTVINGVESVNNLSSHQLRAKPESFIRTYKGLAISIIADRITIGDLKFRNIPVRVTPYTTGNILLGMDIIKEMDVHIGRSKITGKTVLLACKECEFGNDYLLALHKHFAL